MLPAPRPLFARIARASVVLSTALAATSCESYEPPPEVALEGLDANGVLADPAAPLRVRFSSKVDRPSLQLKIAEFVTDNEYRLGDEPGATPGTPFTPLYTFPPGPATFDEAGDPLPIDALEFLPDPGVDAALLRPARPLPVGSQLVLLVEPGLRGDNGVATVARRKLTFSYGFSCKGAEKPGAFTTGKYLFLVQVNKPIGTQIRLYTSFRVDPATGAFVGQFTNASRRTDLVCPQPCDDKKVCRLLPAPACVTPSERAGSVDEYPDFYPNFSPPTGWSFTATGCVDAQPDGSVRFGARSPRADVAQPKVTIENISIFGSFKTNEKGELRGTGTFSAGQVSLGVVPSGEGRGDIVALRLPDDKAPAGIPEPPAAPPAP